jgi:hypothetical protein
VISVNVMNAVASRTNHETREFEMYLLNETLARERMREHDRLVADAHTRRMLSRLAAARRLQRRADSASRRARALLLSL